ncbi:MAG: hypothetical protein NTV58_18105 [Deltaproteobacteria bacterium]|nr:hypothetical protein [Deltaproteobacteria bacterium]
MTDDKRKESLKFFVYIVESPSAPDMYHGRSEGALVARAIDLDGIPSATRIVINKEALSAALNIGLPDVMKQFAERFPIIHLSAHGSGQGIQLSNGDTLSWYELRQMITPINLNLGGFLLLCMSACKGYSACQMAMQTDNSPDPYFAMVGNFGTPTWADTAVAYSAFYHLLSKGHSIPNAVEGMKAACGDSQWIVETAEDAKKGYLEYLQKIEPSQVQQALESTTDAANLPPSAKALERSIS